MKLNKTITIWYVALVVLSVLLIIFLKMKGLEAWKTFSYWFVGINISASAVFMFLCCVFGARDLFEMLSVMKNAEVDETDDGRVDV